jgi:CSLREA domain-containing protein
VLGLVLAPLLFGSARVAHAAAFTVNSTADAVDANPGNGICADGSGNCTLRAAIMEANALAGSDIIGFSVAGTISLGSALPAIAQNLTIIGPGPSALTVKAAGSASLLIVNAGVTANISGLTATGGIGSGAGGSAGGGIDNEGTLTLTNMSIVANTAQYGGGIYNAPGAKLTLVGSTIDGNTAAGGIGGAIYNVGGGTSVTITGSTISRNTSSAGAINAPVGTSVSISNSTISGNIGTGAGSVAGILGGPNVTVTSSTIYGNTGIGAFGCKLKNTIVDSCGSGGGVLASLGHNLAPSSACFSAPGPGDVFTSGFLLGPLQNNGGPTETHALLAGSPAIDAVPPASCTVNTDQRGVARPQGAGCDIGALELIPPPTPTPTSTDTRTPTATRTATPTASATPACVSPPAGMVAWWPLNVPTPVTFVDDIWTFNNDGTVVGPPGWGTGWVNGAFQFDGASNYLDVPSAPSLNFGPAAATPPGDFSIDAWIMLPQSAAASGVRSIVDKRQGAGSLGYQFYLFNQQMGLQLADTTFSNYNSTFAIPADGTWHHIAVTVERNQSSGIRFYYDGAPVGATGNALLHQGTLANTNNLRIGAQLFGGEFLDGWLDEVEIFDRALSPTEIQAISNAQRSGKCLPTPSATPTATASATPTATATATPTRTPTNTPTPSGHAEVCVLKFNDANGNGIQDAGESGIPGWKIEITDLSGNVVAFITTGSTGILCTGVPAPATYTVFEVPQAGWTQTFPPPPGLHTVSVANGQLLNLSFGNYRGTITPPPPPSSTATSGATVTVTRSPTPTPTLHTTPTAATCVTPPPDMVAWWSLNESPGAPAVQDIAGFPNTGTPRDATGAPTTIGAVPGSGPVPVTSPPLSLPSGMVGSALYFYGPYIEVSDQSDLDFGAGDLTIDAWVWPPAPFGGGATISPIVDKLDLNQKTGYAFYLFENPGGPYNILHFMIGNGVALSNSSSAVSATYGAWNHVAVTVNRNVVNGVTFYIDGVASGAGPQSAGNSDNALPLWIGKSRLSPPAGFSEFAIDELEIFNRALSLAEVQSIFAAGSAGKCKPHRCAGDCDGSARVTVDELVRGVSIALGTIRLEECPAFDLNQDGLVTVNELIDAVHRALDGCA